MASWKYADDSNLGAVTLGSGYTAASGTMSLTAGHGVRLPSSGDFWMAYDTGSGIRIFKVTARSTDTLTVVADASEGIGDGNISSGETLRPVVTNDTITQLKADIVGDAAIAHDGLVLLKTLTASSSASLDFTTREDGTAIIQSDFDNYLIEFIQITPATNATKLGLRVSTNGGSSYDSGANYSWGGNRNNSGGQVVLGVNGDTLIGMNDGQSNTASDPGLSGQVILFNPGSGVKKPSFIGQSMEYNTGLSNNTFSALYNSVTAVNAFQFLMSSGNITSGTIRVYGVTKATTTRTLSSNLYGTYASLPASCVTGDTYHCSDSPYTFVATATNVWTAFYKGHRVIRPGTISFTDLNSPASSSTTGGIVYWKSASAGFRGKLIAVPSAPYTIRVLFRVNVKTSNFARAGIILYDGTKVWFYGLTDASQIKSSTFSSVTAFNGDNSISPDFWHAGTEVWLELTDDNTNWLGKVSYDGVTFSQTLTQTRLTYLTPTHVGLGIHNENGSDIHISLISFEQS